MKLQQNSKRSDFGDFEVTFLAYIFKVLYFPNRKYKDCEEDCPEINKQQENKKYCSNYEH